MPESGAGRAGRLGRTPGGAGASSIPTSKRPSNLAAAGGEIHPGARGNTPRLYRNTLVFLAADKTRLQDLDEAARKLLAWESILAEQEQPRSLATTR